MANPTIVAHRLWFAAAHQAAALGYEIASSCEHHLRPFLESGAYRMATEGVLDNGAHVVRAEASARAFVAAMVIEAQKLGYTELHEPTFFEAKKYFCPLWPFCD